MNENLKLKVPLTIHKWIVSTTELFQTYNIPTPRLDAEVLLAHALDVNRTWLHAHSETELSLDHLKTLDEFVDHRCHREPVAYITGYKEFYGRNFSVSHDVLIPRPESETIIELLATLPLPSAPQLIDVGTGSGCLGISATLEIPFCKTTITDISAAALEVAVRNARSLGAPVHAVKSDLLSSFDGTSHMFDVILANLPYVDRSWKTPPELDHEPALALYADDGGLDSIYQLLDQAPAHLQTSGYILLEADPEQHAAISVRAKQNGLVTETIRDYIIMLKKQ